MSNTFDIDALISDLDVTPVEVTLAGSSFTVRRDLSGKEVVRYWELVRSQQDSAALAILVGSEESGTALNGILEGLPQKRMIAATQKIMQLAGLMSEEQAGE